MGEGQKNTEDAAVPGPMPGRRTTLGGRKPLRLDRPGDRHLSRDDVTGSALSGAWSRGADRNPACGVAHHLVLPLPLRHRRRRLELVHAPRLCDEALAAIIHDDRVEVFVLYVRGVPAGYAELDRRVEGEIEIAYLGLVPEYVGRGFGAFLLDWALGRAWSYGPTGCGCTPARSIILGRSASTSARDSGSTTARSSTSRSNTCSICRRKWPGRLPGQTASRAGRGRY